MTVEDKAWEAFERKDARRAKVAQILKLAGVFPPVDWFFETRFSRDFDAVAARPQNKPYLLPQEFEDPDEADIIDKLATSFANDTIEELPEGAGLAPDGNLNYRFIDPHWGHTTGQLYGSLKVDSAALDVLHPDLRVGLFANGADYEVFARPNFLDDGKALPIAINRMSLKLRMPHLVPNAYDPGGARELDLLLSEGLPPTNITEPDGQGFFFRDARQLLMANEAKHGGFDAAKILLDKQDGET